LLHERLGSTAGAFLILRPLRQVQDRPELTAHLNPQTAIRIRRRDPTLRNAVLLMPSRAAACGGGGVGDRGGGW
jgi:hypothetical protein